MDLFPPKTIRNRLHEVQLRARVPATGVSLTTQHMARHLAWYRRHRTWALERHRVLFRDELCFGLGRNDGHRRYVGDPKMLVASQ
ncbi:hypothetical protein TNCV_22131 [Trichonephila clavipes]|nr:hypothetical protein TNCV_22131 [Trichonephila clavipes]